MKNLLILKKYYKKGKVYFVRNLLFSIISISCLNLANATAWVNIDQMTQAFPAHINPGTTLSSAVDKFGDTYVVFDNNNDHDKLMVEKISPNKEINSVGRANLDGTINLAQAASIAIDPNTNIPYIAVADKLASGGRVVKIMKYDGYSWTDGAKFMNDNDGADPATNIKLAIAPSGKIWIAYTQSYNGQDVYHNIIKVASCLNGECQYTNPSPLFNQPDIDATYGISLAINKNIPFLSFVDSKGTGTSRSIHVMQYDGGWTATGTNLSDIIPMPGNGHIYKHPDIEENNIIYNQQSIAFDNNNKLYLAFVYDQQKYSDYYPYIRIVNFDFNRNSPPWEVFYNNNDIQGLVPTISISPDDSTLYLLYSNADKDSDNGNTERKQNIYHETKIVEFNLFTQTKISNKVIINANNNRYPRASPGYSAVDA